MSDNLYSVLAARFSSARADVCLELEDGRTFSYADLDAESARYANLLVSLGLKRGDRVQTIGGILGTVVETRDGEVLLKVDEGNNTKIRFSRNAIHRVLEEEKAEVK